MTSIRDRFLIELRSAPSLDENGYICTKAEAIKAFDRVFETGADIVHACGGNGMFDESDPDDTMHVTLGQAAEGMSPKEIKAAAEEWRHAAIQSREQSHKAAAALQGLPYAAVPLDQLADIYKRFLRLLRLGSLPLDEWEGMPEKEVQVRRTVFHQADFGAVFAGQWLPRELREEIRNLVKGKNYDHQFDHHEVAYRRKRMDGLLTAGQ